MTDKKQFKEPVAVYDATALQYARIEVMHSERRDPEAKGKYYAFIRYYDEDGNEDCSRTTDDYDKPEDAIEELKRESLTIWTKLLVKDIDKIK